MQEMGSDTIFFKHVNFTYKEYSTEIERKVDTISNLVKH